MKLGVVGAGNIGANIACSVASLNLVDEISLIDIYENLAKGKALDIQTASIIAGHDIKINGGTSYDGDFDIVVITAGVTRKEGQTRDELASINAKIVADSSRKISEVAPNSIIIVVTNPLDLMVYVAYKASGFSKNKVLGMAGELDTARANLIDKNAKVFGYHNDDMLISSSLDGGKFKELEKHTKTGGAIITNLIGTSAYFAPAMAVVKMIKALKNGGTVIASVLDGDEIPFGREVELDKNGIKNIIDHEIYNKADTNTIKKAISNLDI